jgi:hypothetical protein
MVSEAIVGKNSLKPDNPSTSSGTGQSFKAILDGMDVGNELVQNLGLDNRDLSPTNQIQSLGGSGIDFNPVNGVANSTGPNTGERILDMLGEVNKGQIQMDSIVNHILYSGQKFSSQELLVIQAHVFHFAQMTELTVKVAEQGVSSLKSVFNTQVQ